MSLDTDNRTGPPTDPGNFPPTRHNGSTIGSLCTGVGGLDLAVEQASGGQMIWCAEKMSAAARVIEKRFGVPNYGDLTTLDPKSLPPVDILTAGFPCQPFSIRGKRRGTDDERHIWPSIADIIDTLQPKAVVLENVRELIKTGFNGVLADLARMGFNAEWGVVTAAHAGAPHQRARLFVVARPANPASPGTSPGQSGGASAEVAPAVCREFPLPGSGTGGSSGWTGDVGCYGGRLAQWERATRPAPRPVEADVDGRACIAPSFVEWLMGMPEGWVTDPGIGLTADEQLRVLGNAVVPQQAYLALSHLVPRAFAVGIPAAA